MDHPTWQSSTSANAEPEMALDGMGACAVTNSDMDAWWSVDLGEMRTVYSVAVFQRATCCCLFVFVDNFRKVQNEKQCIFWLKIVHVYGYVMMYRNLYFVTLS